MECANTPPALTMPANEVLTMAFGIVPNRSAPAPSVSEGGRAFLHLRWPQPEDQTHEHCQFRNL
jgi:hypothetical protein